MELHTLGVKGGYTQKDVTTLADLLTGWTLNDEAPGDGSGGDLDRFFALRSAAEQRRRVPDSRRRSFPGAWNPSAVSTVCSWRWRC